MEEVDEKNGMRSPSLDAEKEKTVAPSKESASSDKGSQGQARIQEEGNSSKVVGSSPDTNLIEEGRTHKEPEAVNRNVEEVEGDRKWDDPRDPSESNSPVNVLDKDLLKNKGAAHLERPEKKVEKESVKEATGSSVENTDVPLDAESVTSKYLSNSSLNAFVNNKQNTEIISTKSLLRTTTPTVQEPMIQYDKEEENTDANSVPLESRPSETLVPRVFSKNHSELLMSVGKNTTPDTYPNDVNESPSSNTSNTNDHSESMKELHSSCVSNTLLSKNSNGRECPLINKDRDQLDSVNIDAAAALHSLENPVAIFDSPLSTNNLITPQEMPSESSSTEESAIFEVPLIMETPIVLHSSNEAKFNNELTLLEKESLDAAIEIETTQAVDALTNQCIIHEHLVNSEHQVVKTNTTSVMSRNSHDSDMEVVNETSSDDNDEDIDLHQSKKAFSFVPRAEEEMEDENRNENEEFNKLWNTINSQPSPETAIMEEVEDEFLKDLEPEVRESQSRNTVEKIIFSRYSYGKRRSTTINENNKSPKDDKGEGEDISKIAAFIHETSTNTTASKKKPRDEQSKKSPFKIKLANRVGRPPNRVGRPPNRTGKPPNRVGRPPNRVGRPPNRVGRPPKTVKVDSEAPSIKELSSAPTKSDQDLNNDEIISPEPVICTYESDWRKIMRMKDTCYDKFIDQIFYNINFPGAIPYIPRLYNNISKSCADSLSSWDVEKLQCPACPDSFLIPTSFFQHLYRKSCEIMFKCKLCDDLDSSVSSIEIDHALLRPPRGMDHMHQTNNTVLESFTCPMILPNECSLSSHSRIHQGIGPYVCPECGDEFQTLSIFKEHVLDYCLHEYRTLIYTCPLRHKEKKHFALNPSNLLEHINDHHVKLLYKCSYCSRAFTKESAIHIHLKEEHSNIPEYLTEKEDFTLLYKTLISKERRIFGKKESFENKEILREHGIKWCRLQKSSSDAVVSSPILFPLEKANNVPLSSSHGNENFCNKENCLKCTEIFDLIQKHKHDCVTGDNEGNEQIESYSDVERSNTPSQKVDRSRLRSTYISEEVSSFSNHGSEFNEEEEIDVTDEPTSAPRKRGRKPKVKPLVEVLGLNVPSSKSILHFNRLHKQAMSLGSTVLPKRMRTSLHNGSLCDYKSNDRLSFLAHIKEHSEKYDNSSNTFLQCKECGMSFASEPSWKKHLFLIHRIRHPAPSDYLTDLTHLDEDSGDRRLVIDEDRANVCQVCSRSFDSPKDLKKHSRGHGVSPLVSQNRKRSFTST
ncbi:unnamed protein product [Lepeophtheirus salmonis]|uniref:(salmon louse) hypothetical protein n=1 Tax=Lepeophtheirus salmonis TaxID=72036 RepID=A0A7R8CZP4_LEPSM|nr:unnamed protein product [Lepeophtheirus salmonis]CAF2977761.1 unnamed protein product [Lepeophtheirus salmonis]